MVLLSSVLASWVGRLVPSASTAVAVYVFHGWRQPYSYFPCSSVLWPWYSCHWEVALGLLSLNLGSPVASKTRSEKALQLLLCSQGHFPSKLWAAKKSCYPVAAMLEATASSEVSANSQQQAWGWDRMKLILDDSSPSLSRHLQLMIPPSWGIICWDTQRNHPALLCLYSWSTGSMR